MTGVGLIAWVGRGRVGGVSTPPLSTPPFSSTHISIPRVSRGGGGGGGQWGGTTGGGGLVGVVETVAGGGPGARARARASAWARGEVKPWPGGGSGFGTAKMVCRASVCWWVDMFQSGY